jgi:hypothetical protein
MCNFFSCVSDGIGNLYYFDWHLRQQVLSGKITLEPDSHSSIAKNFGLDEDKCNKYEKNPLTGQFIIDQINTTDDSDLVADSLACLDWKKIVPALVVKPIVNPFQIERPSDVSEREKRLLKKWASVGASVWDSVGASVGDSVGDSVGAYVGSFFKLPSWKFDGKTVKRYPFRAGADLWEAGLVPSFDGKTWRLHAGPDAKIVYEYEAK